MYQTGEEHELAVPQTAEEQQEMIEMQERMEIELDLACDINYDPVPQLDPDFTAQDVAPDG